MEYFKPGFGLVTENDPITENCNLFYAEYLTLKVKRLHVPEDSDFDFFMTNMAAKINAKGLYNRRSIETIPVRSVSHDEITGWMVTSKILGTNHRKEIWEHLLKHFGSYNNTGKLSDYIPFNPANLYNWGDLANSHFSFIFFPLYLINMLIAIHKDKQKTSSKLIYWLELSIMKQNILNNFLWKVFTRQMVRQYGEHYLNELFNIYFHMESQENFPIFQELNKL